MNRRTQDDVSSSVEDVLSLDRERARASNDDGDLAREVDIVSEGRAAKVDGVGNGRGSDINGEGGRVVDGEGVTGHEDGGGLPDDNTHAGRDEVVDGRDSEGVDSGSRSRRVD